MTEIVGKKTEIEAIDDIDNTKGESSLENTPHKYSIDAPVESDFFCYEVKTNKKGRETADDESRENKHNAVEIFFAYRDFYVLNYSVERYERDTPPDDESQSRSSHQVVCLEHAITD